MANIKPFSGFCYNADKISEVSKVICPPYDIITPLAQEHYHKKSPYNIIRLELGMDIAGQDKYRRAAVEFNKWIKEQILIQDKTPAIYFYNQDYNLKGERRSRLGFIALLQLEDKRNAVFPHERTRLEPKEDRLRLIKRVKANLSPIFVLFSDQERIIRRTYEQYIKDATPAIAAVDEERVSHKIWKLDAADALKRIQAQMLNKNIFIADGHHRYEVATSFREHMKKKLGSLSSESDINYIMAYFTSIESHGLSILPVHRLIRKVGNFRMDNFKEAIKEYFDIQELKDKNKFLFLMEKAGARQNTLGMYKDKTFYLLRLKSIKILDKEILDRPKDYRALDVSILNYLILRKFFALDLEDKEKIKFSPDCAEFISEVDHNKNSLAFFLNPVKVEQLVSIAAKGEIMPSKSTYFYPKVPAGLVINKFKI
jgi:uncharacterized protein (DUF1015 family)